MKDGELSQDFINTANHVYFLNLKTHKKKFINKNILRLKNILFSKDKKRESYRKIFNKILSNNYELIYGNTIASLDILFEFQKENLNCVIAIHELSYALETIKDRNQIIEKINKIKHIVAGSKAVAENLIENYKVEENKINIIHSFIEKNILIKTKKTASYF